MGGVEDAWGVGTREGAVVVESTLQGDDKTGFDWNSRDEEISV